eukprot:g4486.t1
MKKGLEIKEITATSGKTANIENAEVESSKIKELPTASFLEREQKKNLLQLDTFLQREGEKNNNQNMLKRLSMKFKRGSLLAVGGSIDPDTGDIVPPSAKDFKTAAVKELDKWCLKGEGNTAVKAFYYIAFTILLLLYGMERVEEANYKYYLSNAISERILTDESDPFSGVNNADSFWSYVHGPLSSITKSCSNTTNKDCYASISDSVVLIDDFVFMQLKRKASLRDDNNYGENTGCYVPPILNKNLDKEINKCYLDFMRTEPDLRFWSNDTIIPNKISKCFLLYDFGRNAEADEKHTRQTVFTTVTAPEVNTRYNTWFHLNYGYKGYRICTFNFCGESMKQELKLLQQHNYIDSGTTIVFVDFTVYSANLQAIAHVQLVFEFIPSGDIYPTYNIDVFSVSGLTEFGTTKTFGVLIILEIAVAIQLFSLMMNIYGVGRHKPREFFCNTFFIYNALCLTLYVLVFIMEHCLIALRQQVILEEDVILKNMNIVNIAYFEGFMTSALAIAVLMTVFRVIQFLKFSKRLSLIILTIERAFAESGFTLLTVILVVFSYALAFYISLGSAMKEFRNLRTSFMTCLASLFVEIDLIEEIMVHSRYLGPVLLVTYMFFVSFVVLSLFLAIIEAAFVAIKSEAKKEKVDPLVAAFKEEAKKHKRQLAAITSFPNALKKLRPVNHLNRLRKVTESAATEDSKLTKLKSMDGTDQKSN